MNIRICTTQKPYRMSMHDSNLLPQQNISNNWQCSKHCGQDVLIINRFQRKIVNLQHNKNNIVTAIKSWAVNHAFCHGMDNRR